MLLLLFLLRPAVSVFHFFFDSVQSESEINLPMSALNQKGVHTVIITKCQRSKIEEKKKWKLCKKCGETKKRRSKMSFSFFLRQGAEECVVCTTYSYNKHRKNSTRKNSMMNRSLMSKTVFINTMNFAIYTQQRQKYIFCYRSVVAFVAYQSDGSQQ